MPGAVRKGIDQAGGKLLKGSPNVLVNNQPVVRVGDDVEGHGRGPHSSPKMQEGSSTVLVNGIPVCRQGDKASCGHPATGSPNVIIG